MKLFANLLISLIIAFWIGAFSIFSIQNIQPLSLQFLLFETVALPTGILLAFSIGTGLVLGAIAPLFWSKKRTKRRQPREEFDLE